MNLISEVFCESIRPPPILNVWEWADEYRFLDETSAEPGRYRTDRTPYLRKIMECLSETHPCKKVVFMKSSQVGGSESGLNFLGYLMHQCGGSIMYLFPSTGEAEKYSKNRIDRMIDSCPVLTDVRVNIKGKGDASTILRKAFKTGYCDLTGAQTAKGLKSTPYKNILMTEVDGYPADVDGEGDPVKLSEKRVSTFSRSKIFLESTPTIEKMSRIEAEFKKGNQQTYRLACPCCGFKQKLIFPQLKFKTDLDDSGKKIVIPDSVYYECIDCKKEIKEYNKTKMMSEGEWVAENLNGVVGIESFHINALYAPIGLGISWAGIVQEFLETNDDNLKLKVFINTILGQTYKESIQQPDWTIIRARAEPFKIGYVPDDCVVLYAGVDVQGNRLAYHIVGFGENMEMWTIEYDEIFGDPIHEDVWQKLNDKITSDFYYQNNEKISLRVKGCAVDTGFLSSYCYDFIRQNQKLYWAFKGATNDDGGAFVRSGSEVDKGPSGKAWADSLTLWLANTQLAKKTIYSMLKNTSPGSKYFHISQYMPDNFFQMLCSELLVSKIKNGNYVQRFEKPTDNTRNEALDTAVYAYCLARMQKVDDLRGKVYENYKAKIFGILTNKNQKEETIKLDTQDSYTKQQIAEKSVNKNKNSSRIPINFQKVRF